ncbi:MAG TPA: peptidoglycan bridge formation glycyltransferase FemA/FemB family protein [Polyangiaceae bacterium]|jgi:hypothetical protein
MNVTWARDLRGAEADAFDAFVLGSPSGHYAQTRAWAEVARAAGTFVTSLAVVRAGGAIVGTALVTRPAVAGVGMPWARIERGPVVRDVDCVAEATRAIARTMRRRGVAWLRVMPYWAGEDADRVERALRSDGWRDAQTVGGSHALTLRLDLTGKDDAALFAGKAREQVRWRARQAEKAGATARVGTGEDWTRLRAMHAGTMRAQGRRGRPPAWWGALERFASDDARGRLFACDLDGRCVAAAVVLRHGPLAVYAWGASVAEKLPFTKAVPALVAGIRWARDAGCSTFDLGGIPLPEDRDPKRAAIATFKHDFDRTPVRLVREHAGWC